MRKATGQKVDVRACRRTDFEKGRKWCVGRHAAKEEGAVRMIERVARQVAKGPVPVLPESDMPVAPVDLVDTRSETAVKNSLDVTCREWTA
jgi:hypothetical protein